MSKPVYTYYFNGKRVSKKSEIPKGAKLVEIVHKKYYENETYREEQDENAHKYFTKMRELREDQELYHG